MRKVFFIFLTVLSASAFLAMAGPAQAATSTCSVGSPIGSMSWTAPSSTPTDASSFPVPQVFNKTNSSASADEYGNWALSGNTPTMAEKTSSAWARWGGMNIPLNNLLGCHTNKITMIIGLTYAGGSDTSNSGLAIDLRLSTGIAGCSHHYSFHAPHQNIWPAQSFQYKITWWNTCWTQSAQGIYAATKLTGTGASPYQDSSFAWEGTLDIVNVRYTHV